MKVNKDEYCIVANMGSPLSPIRHIIVNNDEAISLRKFKKWYYSYYIKIKGDIFIPCTKDEKEKILNVIEAEWRNNKNGNWDSNE